MRLLIGFLFTSVLVCLCCDVFAQTKAAAIEGKILTKDHLLVDAATIALVRSRDSALIKTVVSNKNGAFLFNNLKQGQYLILISKVGFQKTYKGPFALSTGTKLTVDDIELQSTSVTLAEVIVLDHKKYLEVRPDKTVLNLNHSILTTGVSTYDVLRTAPGVKIGADGEILYHAGGKATIAINGKEVKLDSQELANLLESLQSSNVEQIELISDPSVKYENAGTGGVINIIFKKGKNEGLNGSVTASGGYGPNYKSNLGGSWNYRDRGLNFFGGAAFSDNKYYRQIDIERSAGTSVFDTHYRNTRTVPSFDYNAGMDLGMDSAHTIGVYVKGNFSRYDIPKRTVSNIYNSGSLDSILFTTSDITRHTNSTLVDLNYSGAIGNTKQILSANADYIAYNRSSKEYIKSTSRPGDTTYFFNIPPFSVRNSSFKIDYSNPFSKKLTLEAGAKYSYLTYADLQNFDLLIKGTYLPSVYTSDFDYTEKISRGYVSLNYKSAHFSYRAGLSMEHTASSAYSILNLSGQQFNHKVIKSYTNFFPNLLANYSLDQNNQLQFVYDNRLDRPGYEKLDPTVAYQDQYNINQGNAYLKPAYAQRFKLSETYKGKYLISLYYTSVSDFWDFTYYQQDDSIKLLKTTNRNLERKANVGVILNIPVVIANWWELNLNVDASYFRFIDYKTQSNLNKGTQDVNFDLDQSFYLTKTLTAHIQSHFETATFYGILNYKPVFYTNIGLSKHLSVRSTLTCNIWDITNGNYLNKTYTTFGNLNLTARDKTESRYVRLTYTYNFGKQTVKASRRHTTGNSEEQGRMGNGY